MFLRPWLPPELRWPDTSWDSSHCFLSTQADPRGDDKQQELSGKGATGEAGGRLVAPPQS